MRRGPDYGWPVHRQVAPRSRLKVGAWSVAGALVAAAVIGGVIGSSQGRHPSAAPHGAAQSPTSATRTHPAAVTTPTSSAAATTEPAPTVPAPTVPASTVPAPTVPASRAAASSAQPRRTTSPPRPSRVAHPPAATPVLALVSGLAVKGRAPMTGYDREQFGQPWYDEDGNGCDTRNDTLRRDLTAIVIKPDSSGCSVLSGRLADPYTGDTISFQRGRRTSSAVQIDHIVALGDAWQTGAQYWTAEERRAFANDPLELLAVDGSTNESKGDGDTATWLPPNKAFRCSYVARQAAVKATYRLWVTAAEAAAMRRVLAGCPATPVPTSPTAPLMPELAAATTQPATVAPTTEAAVPTAYPAAVPTAFPTTAEPTTAPPAPSRAGGGDHGGATAQCNDGTFSYAAHHRGACSHHHGVAVWFR
ncbi:MAG: GmrSD restriction endonuclease domain-containing protein [Mycobacteriales bacterium]